jgi:4-carboxymuconolactone decarboxylase
LTKNFWPIIKTSIKIILMRLNPQPPENLIPEIRFVHDEISKLIGHSQGQVTMVNEQGALLGPFIPMLYYPQFGVPALSFLRTLNTYATLPKTVREVAILTVAGVLGARFELYAHEIMAQAFGIPTQVIATLAGGGHPNGLNEQESIAHSLAFTLVHGHYVPDSSYEYAVAVLGKDAVAELIFLISGYAFIAMILNGFDIPSPEVLK